jgi:predicted SnoaL-like aldol condensation-catalyzing enzyme
MSIEDNKAIVSRFLNEVFNKGNLAVANESMAQNYTSHNQLEIDIFRIENGKLAEAWLEINVEGFRRQLSLEK